MPIMGGLEATREIFESIQRYKHSPQYELAQKKARDLGVKWYSPDKVKIVALTANDTPADEEICIKAGMTNFLSKPPNQEQLKTTIESVFGTQ